MNNQLYISIILKDGSVLHKAKLFKNKNPKHGELLLSCKTKEEIEEILNNKKNKMIGFSTANIQGYISTATEIESYAIINMEDSYYE